MFKLQQHPNAMNSILKLKTTAFSILVLGFFFSAQMAYSQNGKIKKGDKLYEHLVYPGAIAKYERGLAKTQDLRAMERLADAYVQVSNSEKAEQWYGTIVKMKGAAPVNKLKYGQTLMANGKYDEAQKWFQAYLETGESPSMAARMVEACNFAEAARKEPSRYTVNSEPVNTGKSEFSPVMYQQGLIFTGERRGAFTRFINLRNNNNFYDLYYAQRDPNKKSGVKVKRLKGKVNRKFHEGPATVNKDQNTLYFTRSHFVKDKKGKMPINHSKLMILTAEKSKKKWKNINSLPFNSDNYSCGHPTLSADGQSLIFSSDIPGGFGGTDLYICTKQGDSWSTPQNLGSSVNSEGDEQFPYLHKSGALFFSSDGHAGFGGFDIFAAPVSGDRWGKAVNGGFGLNSQYDDFGITWLPNKSAGYFSSDREGDDNIYMFKRQMKINGTIVDKRTGKPLEGVTLSLLDASNHETKLVSDENGDFSYMAQWGKDYLLTANKNEYLQLRERVTTSNLSPLDDLNAKYEMEPDLILAVLGKVTDAETKAPIQDAKVSVISAKGLPYKTDAEGNYFAQVMEEQEYTVIIEKSGYVPQVFGFSTEGKKKSEDFTFNAPLVKGSAVIAEGKAFVNETRAPLAGVNVRSIDMGKQVELKGVLSRKDGRFWHVLNPAVDQILIGSKVGFFSARAELPDMDSTMAGQRISVEIGMVPYEVGALVKIIYYDYNKSDIKRVASKDLYEIVYFLQDNPEASVQLSSYTDSRGGDKYNERLSQQRADAAARYISSKNISRSRVASKGYGETNLVNKCKDGVKCTDEEHSANRRTEIRITKLDLGKVREGGLPVGYFKE